MSADHNCCRRTFGASLGVGLVGTAVQAIAFDRPSEATAPTPPAFSVIPVVGDGKWVWNKPPKETGYLEPRNYKLSVGIELEGTGNSQMLRATTPAPVQHPEQKINHVNVQQFGCTAGLRPLAEGAGQLTLAAPAIRKGQKITATANYDLTLFKQFQKYQKDQFPVAQELSKDVKKNYMGNSKGILVHDKTVRDLAAKVAGTAAHPWDKALAFFAWVRKNIRPQLGAYTSVKQALATRRGDCEEYAGVFVAFCRTVGIPARLVWVPNHAWAEFYLTDHDGKGHWIPAHTACYNWFGWTGAHELVIQKGDRIYIPEKKTDQRLLEDWMQWRGAKPRVKYTAELTPVADSGADPGPGARAKDDIGRWNLLNSHALDSSLRDGRYHGRSGSGQPTIRWNFSPATKK